MFKMIKKVLLYYTTQMNQLVLFLDFSHFKQIKNIIIDLPHKAGAQINNNSMRLVLLKVRHQGLISQIKSELLMKNTMIR